MVGSKGSEQMAGTLLVRAQVMALPNSRFEPRTHQWQRGHKCQVTRCPPNFA